MDKIEKTLVVSVILCAICLIYSGIFSHLYMYFGLTTLESQFHAVVPLFIILFIVVIDLILVAFNDIIYEETNVA